MFLWSYMCTTLLIECPQHIFNLFTAHQHLCKVQIHRKSVSLLHHLYRPYSLQTTLCYSVDLPCQQPCKSTDSQLTNLKITSFQPQCLSLRSRTLYIIYKSRCTWGPYAISISIPKAKFRLMCAFAFTHMHYSMSLGYQN